MFFAIEEINNSTDLLPGISLGYKIYDVCGSIARGVRVSLALANGNQVLYTPTEAKCTRPAQVQAIIGETSSSPWMAIATVIGPFTIPLVGKRVKSGIIFVKSNYFSVVIPAGHCNICFRIIVLHIFMLGYHLFFLSDQPLCYLCLSQ